MHLAAGNVQKWSIVQSKSLVENWDEQLKHLLVTWGMVRKEKRPDSL